MKRFTIFILSILFCLSASAQYDSTKKLQPVGAYGNANNNGSYAGLLRIPRHNNTMAVADSGAIAYKNGTIRVWNGTAWVEVVGSGGGSSVLTTAEAQWPARFDSVGVDSIRFKLAESFVNDTIQVAYDAAHTLVKRGDTLRMLFLNGDSTTVGVVASGGSGEISAGEGIRTYGNIVTWADTLTQSKNLYLLGGSYSQYTKWQSLYGGSFAGWETRSYKNDMSEYSFVNIQPSSISLQSFAGGKNNYLKVQGDITIHTQDSGLLKITAPLPAGASNDSVLVKGADNVVRLVPQQGANTLQGAFNGSIGTDPAIDGGGNPLVMNNLGYTEITATDDVNINSDAINTFSGRIVYVNSIETLTLNSDTLRIRIGGASAGKVLTATDSYGTATWQTPTGGSNVGDSLVKAYDSLAAHNTRIGALDVGKASLSGATFTGRVQLQGVNITKDSIPIVSNKQWVMFIDTATNRVSRQIDIDNEPIVNAMQALGSTYKSTTVGVDVSKIVAAQAFNSGTVYYMVTWIPNDTTITGVSWYQTVAGNYTASGYNGVGLYSYSAGTWTLVASSTNDNNIWTATANTYATKDFTTPYRASKGVYAIAFTYNRSAVTTVPTIGRGGVLTNAAVSSIGTNSAKLYSSSSSTSLPSSIAASSQTTVNTPYFLALY